MHVGKVTLGHLHLLDVVKEINKGFPFSKFLGVTAVEDVVIKEREEETALCLVRATNAFIRHINAVFYAQPF